MGIYIEETCTHYITVNYNILSSCGAGIYVDQYYDYVTTVPL